MSSEKDHCFVYTTCSSLDEAKKIGRTILEKKLAACVSIFPVNTMYLLDEKVKEALEFAIIVETRSEVFEELVKAVKSVHSYENPCICSFKVENAPKEFLKLIDKTMAKSRT